MKSLFTPKDVRKLVGISYRQIQYWDKTGFIRPTYRRRGKYRLYSFGDLMQMKITRTLGEHDFSIQFTRKTIKNLVALLPQVTHPLVELTFLIEGNRVLVFNKEVWLNFTPDKRCVLFEVRKFCGEIEALFPGILGKSPA